MKDVKEEITERECECKNIWIGDYGDRKFCVAG